MRAGAVPTGPIVAEVHGHPVLAIAIDGRSDLRAANLQVLDLSEVAQAALERPWSRRLPDIGFRKCQRHSHTAIEHPAAKPLGIRETGAPGHSCRRLGGLFHMEEPTDTKAAIWRSEEIVQTWAAVSIPQ